MTVAASMRILSEVLGERASQNVKWGTQDHPDGTGSDTHVAQSRRMRDECDRAFRQGRGMWRHILAEEVAEAIACDNPADLREELIQVAAVAVAWIEAIDRRTA